MTRAILRWKGEINLSETVQRGGGEGGSGEETKRQGECILVRAGSPVLEGSGSKNRRQLGGNGRKVARERPQGLCTLGPLVPKRRGNGGGKVAAEKETKKTRAPIWGQGLESSP